MSTSALAAILDSLAAIISISNAAEHFRKLLPEISSSCEKLLNFLHPIVKVGYNSEACKDMGQFLPIESGL